MSYASFSYRLLALLIDLVILSIVAKIIFAVFGLGGSGVIRQLIPSFSSPSAVVAMAIIWLYNVLMVKYIGATIGKMAFGLRVVSTPEVRKDTSGVIESLDWQTVVLREVVGKLISALTGGLGFLWVAWDSKKQGFHDKIAETVVGKFWIAGADQIVAFDKDFQKIK